jgi:hypothetical protein
MAETAEGCQKCKDEAHKHRTTLTIAMIGAEELCKKTKKKTLVFTINNEFTFGTEDDHTAAGAIGYHAMYLP